MEVLGFLLENLLQWAAASWLGSTIVWIFFRKRINKKGILSAFFSSWILIFVVDFASEVQGNSIFNGEDAGLVILYPLGCSLLVFSWFSTLEPFSRKGEGENQKK